MSFKIADAFVEVHAQADTLDREVATSVRKATTNSGVQAEAQRGGSGIGKSLVAGFVGGFVGGAALGAVKGFFGQMISGASDLNETMSKSAVIFGGQAKAMEQWASRAATTLGLSKQQALDAAASFGDMFSQLGFTGDAAAGMSKQVVQLSSDLGSFNNLPTAEVADMISGAFRGEYDSLQRIIPNISAARVEQEALNMTHKKSADDLTAAEKASATLAIVQHDGARAAGDFARTSGGLANQQKIAAAQFSDAAAQLGGYLLPAMTAVMGFVTGSLIPGMSSMTGFLRENREIIGVVAAGILALFLPAIISAGTEALITGGKIAAGWLLAMGPFGAVIAGVTALVAAIVWAWKNSETFRDIVTGVFRVVADVGNWLWRNVLSPVFSGIGAVIMGAWNGAIRPTFDALKIGIDAVGRAFQNVSDWIGRAWGAIREAARQPVQWVIDVVYNNGIRRVWNGMAGIFGMGQLGEVHMARGGVLPGYEPGTDSVPAMLSRGEGILVPEAVRGLGPGFVHWANRAFSGGRARSGGMSHFADGGIVGDIAGLFTDPVGAVRRMFGSVFGDAARIPGSGLLRDAMVKIPNLVMDKIIDKAKSFVASMFSGGGGGGALDQWIAAAMAITGTPASWAGGLRTLIMRESGGNPNAINLWDSNAKAGHPSQGLMQTIPSTFNAYHQPGTSWSITDPIANIAAGINYIKARYGSIFNVQQANAALPPRGYDSGGFLPPGLSTVWNGTGRPEPVLTTAQLDALTSSRGQTVNVYVQQESGSPAETGRMVALALRGVG